MIFRKNDFPPPPSIRSDCERRQGVCAGVRERVHQFHHFRSQREVPSGETQDDKRGRHPVRDVHAGFRHVCGASEALPAEVQRGSVNIFNAMPSYIIEIRALWKHFAQLSEVCLSRCDWFRLILHLSVCSQAMKGEKGISTVTVTEGMGEELTDESFSKYLMNLMDTLLVLRLSTYN